LYNDGRRAAAEPDRIDSEAYAKFCEGLLRHISMEEKILFPSARTAAGINPMAFAATLHLDHGALAALLVPTPTHTIIDAIRTVLERHNPLEEGPGGFYDECERLFAQNADEILVHLQNAPQVAVAVHVDIKAINYLLKVPNHNPDHRTGIRPARKRIRRMRIRVPSPTPAPP
jgi:hypothetical protein